MQWKPIADLPHEAHEWTTRLYTDGLARWSDAVRTLTDRTVDRTGLDLWTTERNRLTALETGQIEGLYTMRRGFTEQLITEGLEHVRTSHTVEGSLDDETLRGLLTDQLLTIEMVFQSVKGERPLSQSVIKEWHALLTRHQRYAPGMDIHGRRIGIPFVKGAYKRRPNNPRRPDGVIHEYAPPEQTTSEMERLLTMHHAHGQAFPTPVEAAWLHHRFVQIHPFEDGNGRVARTLMSYVYVQRGEPPPIITTAEKADYIATLEQADLGDLRPLARMLEFKTMQAFNRGMHIVTDSREGRGRFHHMNGDLSTQEGPHQWTHHRGFDPERSVGRPLGEKRDDDGEAERNEE